MVGIAGRDRCLRCGSQVLARIARTDPHFVQQGSGRFPGAKLAKLATQVSNSKSQRKARKYMGGYSIGCRLLLLLLLANFCVGFQAPAANPSAKHAFSAKDWSTLRSARAKAVSRDGSILYSVTFGGDKGPTKTARYSGRKWYPLSNESASSNSDSACCYLKRNLRRPTAANGSDAGAG